MGREKKSKKSKSNNQIKLINIVRDDDPEFHEFSISIPSIEELTEENFHIAEFKTRSINWYDLHLTWFSDERVDVSAAVDGFEWQTAWSNLNIDGVVNKDMALDINNTDLFSSYSKEDKERFVELMLKDIIQAKTRLSYKKWKFALHNKGKMGKLLGSTSEDIDTSMASSCEEISKEADESESSGKERCSIQDVEELMLKIKVIEFDGRSTQIILQEKNGPCALIAICNILLLRNDLQLDGGIAEISQRVLLLRVLDALNKIKENEDAEKMADAINSLPCLATGTIINIKFNGITQFDYTSCRGVFELLKIPLYHGWIVDPKDTVTFDAIGSKSYDTIKGELAGLERGNKKDGKGDSEETAVLRATRESKVENFVYTPQQVMECTSSTNSNTKLLIVNFLKTQLTTHGLTCLQEQVNEKELCVLYYNDHFNTMYKVNRQLYLLVTDEGFQHLSSHNWEILNDQKREVNYMQKIIGSWVHIQKLTPGNSVILINLWRTNVKLWHEKAICTDYRIRKS